MKRIICFAGIGFGLLVGCGDDSSNPSQKADAATSSPAPSITQLPVDLAIAFDLNPNVDNKIKYEGPIVPFGSIPEGHGGIVEASLLLQMLKRDVDVVSGVSGKVVGVKEQSDTCDSEILIAPTGSDSGPATWAVGYDHVINVTVKFGDIVKPGDVLGQPGSMMLGCDGPGRVELQINNEQAGLAYCPMTMLGEKQQAAESALRDVMSQWNTLTVEAVYDDNEIGLGGCASATAKP